MLNNKDVRRNGAPMSPTGFGSGTNRETNPKLAQWREPTVERLGSNSHDAVYTESTLPSNHSMTVRGVADFFSPEVFQIVLHNPTTAHQLLKFSQSRLCGENMEFLEKVDRYNTLLDEVTKLMSEIHRSFISTEAPRQLNVSQAMTKRMNADIKTTTLTTLPAMELIFEDAQEDVEKLLATDIYPRFVKHQMTMSATKALSNDREKYAGLGDCFCLTNPAVADNPIVLASDGFVNVTGYPRTDIIPRNCRFLQGNYTDHSAVRRLRTSISANQESVELLLNYRKNGEPFWNLLYVAPLFNAEGKLAFFLGGQINCSTTIHSCSDILRVLSISAEIDENNGVNLVAPTAPSIRRDFFKSFRSRSSNKVTEGREAGMEQDLISQIEKLNIKNQMKMFYTAYSKYLVLSYDSLNIEFFSSSIVDMLCLNPKADIPFVGNDIFKVLNQHATNVSKDFKNRIKASLKLGRAISVDINLSTRRSVIMSRTETFATHWTPLKDEHATVKFVVVALASKTQAR